MSAIKHGFGSALSYVNADLNLLTPPQVILANDSETRYITQIYTSFVARDILPDFLPDDMWNYISRFALLRVRLTRNVEPLITYPELVQFELVRVFTPLPAKQGLKLATSRQVRQARKEFSRLFQQNKD